MGEVNNNNNKNIHTMYTLSVIYALIDDNHCIYSGQNVCTVA